MKLFGLTGGMGMGKSTSHRLLLERGVPVIDTDQLARQVVEPGEPGLAEIRRTFGDNFIGADGRLRREELGRKVFGDAAALKQLEAILHPRIRALWQAQVGQWRAEKKTMGVVVIPLLFETGAAASFDAVICIACSKTSQFERLRARGYDHEQIENRIRAQWPIERKLELANYVVWTEGSLEAHAEQLRRILS